MANAASGAAVNDECIAKYTELQAKKMHRFITYKLKDQKEIVVDQVVDREATYDDFANALPENDCRYAVYDFEFVTKEDVVDTKIFFISWSPDTAKVRSKMLYASSSEKFKRGLSGVHVFMHATDASEISVDAIKEKLKGKIKE
ncbi:hypothetical protein ACQ4PT_002238 [Festuca glaucescens]|uniref:actin-depolymerizing factor 3-like n=1 Tax=Lolium rigidum TaxID=89674 RepID=UPI001F5D9384|nr:actin-depolymerizing factor 3-like [Lolium rigidum]